MFSTSFGRYKRHDLQRHYELKIPLHKHKFWSPQDRHGHALYHYSTNSASLQSLVPLLQNRLALGKLTIILITILSCCFIAVIPGLPFYLAVTK
jgi:hypothetical protein